MIKKKKKIIFDAFYKYARARTVAETQTVKNP
jgi:hypothetical protein